MLWSASRTDIVNLPLKPFHISWFACPHTAQRGEEAGLQFIHTEALQGTASGLRQGGALRHISIKKTSFLRNWTVFKSSWLCLLWLHSLHAQSPSHVQVFWLHGLYSPPGSCPWYFPGKNRGAGCLFFSRGSSQHKDRTHMSCVYCTGWWILYH